MAKHKPKKKKIEDTPKPDDSNSPDTHPTEPVVTEDAKKETNRKLDKLFWMRIALAVIGGIAATFLFEPIEGEERRWASIGFMIVVFIGSVIAAKSMKLNLPSSDRKKIVTQGMGSYIFLYLFMWILSYTMVNLPNESGIPTPFS